MKRCISVLFWVLSCALYAAVEIGNGSISVRILPEKGGRISAVKTNDVSFEIPDSAAKTSEYGFTKVRLFNDAKEYMDKPWAIKQQTNRSVTLSITGAQESRRHLAVTETYSVPEQGNYLKVELTFKNTNPIQGSWKIIPWIHNFFPVDSKDSHQSFLSHQAGVDNFQTNPKLVIQKALNNPGNWLAYKGTNKALLMVSESIPETVYSYSAAQGCSLEMLWNPVDPAQPFTIVYYLIPLKDLQEALAVPPPIPALSPAFTIKRTAGNSIDVLTYFQNKSQRNLPVDFRFPKECAYVSPDCTLPLVWAVRAIAPTGDLQFEVDLPENVQLLAWVGNYWWHNQEDMRKISSTQVTVNGKTVTRHRFDVSCRRLKEWFPAHYRLLVKANKNATDGTITYRGFHNGTMTMEESVPCKILSISPARQPKNFKLLMGIDYSLLTTWPDFEKTMAYLGINGTCLNYNVPNTSISEEQIRSLNNRLHQQNFMTAVMGIFYYTKGYLSGKNADRDVKTLDIDGNPSNSFDFTVRGPWMEDISRKDIMHKNLGYDVMISDYEAYFGGNRLGFTPRAIQLFEAHFKINHPELQYIEPKTLALNPQKYPQQYRIWTQFKCDQFTDYMQTMIEKARKASPNGAKVGWCTTPGSTDEAIRIDNLMDNTALSQILDFNMPMLYNNLYHTMNNYRSELQLFQKMSAGKRAQIWPTITLGFWNEPNPFPAEHSYFLLLETAMLQCGGAYLFPGFAGADNRGIRYLSKALDIIARIDNILPTAVRQDGQIRISDCRNTKLTLPAAVTPVILVKGNKMLIWFVEYSQDPVSFTASLNLPMDCKMTSLTDHAISGVWKKGETKTFNLETGDKKGLLLMLETLDGKDIPIVQTAIEDPVEADTAVNGTLLFHDPFEMTTKGKSILANHPIQFSANGKQGACLYLKDYESAWIYPETLDVPTEELIISFWFKAPSNFTKGKGMLWDLFRCNIQPNNRLAWLFFDPQTGKIKLNIGEKKTAGFEWIVTAQSQTEQWPGNIWMHFVITIGKSGLALTVNDKKEIDLKTPLTLSSIKNFQLGRQWVSVGFFDELKIYYAY